MKVEGKELEGGGSRRRRGYPSSFYTEDPTRMMTELRYPNDEAAREPRHATGNSDRRVCLKFTRTPSPEDSETFSQGSRGSDSEALFSQGTPRIRRLEVSQGTPRFGDLVSQVGRLGNCHPLVEPRTERQEYQSGCGCE